MNVVIDVEVVPGDSDYAMEEQLAYEDTIAAPANYKKPEAIAKWMDENRKRLVTEHRHKQCFDATTGEIVTLGFKVGSNPSDCFSLGSGSEEDILQTFFDYIDEEKRFDKTSPLFIGHNHIKFDLPFIWRRAKILGVQVPAYFPPPAELKPWSTNVFDTMVAWAGPQGSISMDRLARVLGFPGKGEMDGSMVWQYYLDGKQADIDAYCIDDVITTALIAEALM